MHVNWRRNFRRPGGSCSARDKGRADSFVWPKRKCWSIRRMQERQALAKGEEVPRWRRTILYDWT